MESQRNNEDALQASKIVQPHHVSRNIYNPRTLLVVASEGCIKVPDDLETFTKGKNGVLVHVTKSLPLETPMTVPVDAIALVYKVFNADSLQLIKDSLPFIDVKYFAGKCFILVISDDKFGSKDTLEIEEFASQYYIPIHFASKVKTGEKTALQIQPNLMSLYCPLVGCDVDNLIIDASLITE